MPGLPWANTRDCSQYLALGFSTQNRQWIFFLTTEIDNTSKEELKRGVLENIKNSCRALEISLRDGECKCELRQAQLRSANPLVMKIDPHFNFSNHKPPRSKWEKRRNRREMSYQKSGEFYIWYFDRTLSGQGTPPRGACRVLAGTQAPLVHCLLRLGAFLHRSWLPKVLSSPPGSQQSHQSCCLERRQGLHDTKV